MATEIYNSDNFNLTSWNIALPVDSSGGTTGISQTVSPLNLSCPYFYANTDGSMTFMAPVTGATTKNSYGARSELRELNPDGTLAAWNLSKGGTMTATLAVNSVPFLMDGKPGKEIIGQIHGSRDELVRLYYDNGKIYFKNDMPASIYPSQTFQLTNAAGKTAAVSLNEKFSYMIDAHGSTLTVKAYIRGDVYTSSTTIDTRWQSDSLYFKAGVYLAEAAVPDVNIKQGTGYGQTTFYGLDMSHIPGQGLGGLQAPVAQSDSFTGEENQPITGNLLSDNGSGADSGPAGLSLKIAPETLTTSHGGLVVKNVNGTFVYTPAKDFFGTDNFTYTLKDGSGLTASNTVNIIVKEVPTIQPIPASVIKALQGVVPTPTMTGTGGNDYLDGVHGKFNNVILGLDGNDMIIGHDGKDVLIGGGGKDKIYGYYGDDVLHSGGSSIMNGGAGNDTLISGSGQNTMTGGTGSDVFVLSEAKTLNVYDIITDFTVGVDKLDISALSGSARLGDVDGKIGIFVDPDGTGSMLSSPVAIFTGTSNVAELTILHDLIV
jgi:hypothetical protein